MIFFIRHNHPLLRCVRTRNDAKWNEKVF